MAEFVLDVADLILKVNSERSLERLKGRIIASSSPGRRDPLLDPLEINILVACHENPQHIEEKLLVHPLLNLQILFEYPL